LAIVAVVPTKPESVAVFIRLKIAKGHRYYQIVEGVRDGERVRQQIVMSLGTTPDPAAALKRMRRELARLERERSTWPREYSPESRTLAHRLERLDVRIAKLRDNVFKLGALIKSKLIGTTEKVRGTMEEITAECGARGLAIRTSPRKRKTIGTTPTKRKDG
jgi:hypothetical protein